MNCHQPNPVARYARCFETLTEAARAAEISTEMLRRMRLRGYVSTRDRAILMSQACNGKVAAAELLAVDNPSIPAGIHPLEEQGG